MSDSDEIKAVDGLICAFVLDGRGSGQPLDWAGVRSWRPSDGVLWIHLDRKTDGARNWLTAESGIGEALANSMLADDACPRVLRDIYNLSVVLRGVNLNPEADPEDMVSVRSWFEPAHIITIRHMRVMAVNDIRKQVEAGNGPNSPGELLVHLADRLIERMAPVIDDINERLDRIEEQVSASGDTGLRTRLVNVRQAAIALRRHLAPQRDALSRLLAEPTSWLSDIDRAFLREIADRTTPYVEDLEAVRERAVVVSDELNYQLSDRMNRTIYVMTVIAAILLPPSSIAGMLGINVGGMPGVDSSLAFWFVVVVVLGIGALEYSVLRKLKWI